jgi:hypothetical protein
MTGSSGSLHDLADEALWLTVAAVADASWPDMQIVVVVAHHDAVRRGSKPSDGAFSEEFPGVFACSAALAA